MKYTIYKPNSKNTGALATLSIGDTKNKADEWEKTLFIEFVPQKSWNSEKHVGQFDHENKKFVAISVSEAGEFLNTLKNNIPFQNFHKSKNGNTIVRASIWEKERTVGKEGDRGYWKGKVSAAVIGVSFNGKSISVPLEPGEKEVVSELLSAYIKQALAQDASNEKKRRKNRESAASKKDENKSSGKVFDDAPQANQEDDDIPF